MFTLFRGDIALITTKHWEDLCDFVNELKELNKKTIDRRDFTIKAVYSTEIFYSWQRK